MVARSKAGLAAMIIGSTVFLGSIAFTGLIRENETKNHIIIEVEYYQNWNATIQINTLSSYTPPRLLSADAWQGFGKMSKNLIKMENEEWNLTVSACKEDASLGQLYIKIKLGDGKVLESTSTSAPFGKAKISMVIP